MNKKIIVFYVSEILVFLILPRFFIRTDLVSYLFMGFVFLLPFTVIILFVLYKYFRNNKNSIILHWIFLLIEVLVGLYLVIAYNASHSIMMI